MFDADDFVAFTTRLRQLHARVDAAEISREQRSRWQRRLIAIADAGQRDLQRAGDLLHRFEAEVDRRL